MRGLLAPLIKLIVFLLVTAFATYVLAATIANTSYGSTTSYKAVFSDASGLQVSDDVRIAGVRVGSVTSIKVLRDDATKKSETAPSLAEVSFTVVKDHPLPKSSLVFLRYRNLVGQRYLDVQDGDGSPNDVLPKGGTIPLGQTQAALDLTKLFHGFQPLFQGLNADQINQLSGEVISALQGEGGAFDQLLPQLADLTNSIADKDQVIGQVVDNLASVLTEVGDRDVQLTNLIDNLQAFISGLSQDRTTIGNAIVGVDNLATTTTSLLTNIRAPLRTDISELGVLSKNLAAPDSQAAINFVLQNTPGTVAALIRTGSYGSWFNFYLCTVSGTITLPGGSVAHIPVHTSPAARCQ